MIKLYSEEKIFIIFLFLVVIAFFLYREYEGYIHMKERREIIQKIEYFRQKYGKLPNSLLEFGVESEGFGPYYEIEENDSSNYIVYFAFGFDHLEKYESRKKRWESTP